MCGIIGWVKGKEFQSIEVLKRLKRLEYRGYDSFGIATPADSFRQVGGISFDVPSEQTNVAIAHTRWATHGGVTEKNAHPHASCEKDLFIVHNGIIENHSDLKKDLVEKGHSFVSDTDTEVIAHYFEEKLKQADVKDAIKQFFVDVEGTFAILLVQKDKNEIWALKKDSPLALGLLDDGFCLASDIYGFGDETKKAIFFDDNEFAHITPEKYEFFDSQGQGKEKEITEFSWNYKEDKQNYAHYMLKEIHEIPLVSERLLQSLELNQNGNVEKLLGLMKKAKKIVFVASGTSYHASLLGAYFLKNAGIETQTVIASEFSDYVFVDENTLVIAVSQSGETMDVIDALKKIKDKNPTITSIVNVPYSTIQRMSEVSLEIMAGQEICVAATKTFVNQVITLLYLAKKLGYDGELHLDKLPEAIKNILALEPRIKELAEELKDKRDIYILGRGMSYPVAREIALKLKEISYVHAEGMMGGELKHGTLALIEEGVPIIALIDQNRDIVANIKEAEARKADVIALSSRMEKLFDKEIRIPAVNNEEFALLATVVGQLLTYYVALAKNLPIDKPRNLAKSVTVK